MKYVVDASVALREVLPGPLTGKAQALKTDLVNKIHDLLAPDIFPAEIASALTKAEGQKLIAVGDGARITRNSPRPGPISGHTSC